MTLPTFNKYLIFADESGDHLLKPNDHDFPLFVLAFCVIERDHYAQFIAPKLLELKLKYLQNPHVILHEREIRKAQDDFSFLTNKEIREQFFEDLNDFMQQAEFKVIASVIHKERLQKKYKTPYSPYDLGTQYGLERLKIFLKEEKQHLEATVTFESRGKKEDRDLEHSFLKITDNPHYRTHSGKFFDLQIVPKISNNCGLQLADLIARPIGRHILKPEQPNKAYDIIKNKFFNLDGVIDGYGLKVFP